MGSHLNRADASFQASAWLSIKLNWHRRFRSLKCTNAAKSIQIGKVCGITAQANALLAKASERFASPLNASCYILGFIFECKVPPNANRRLVIQLIHFSFPTASNLLFMGNLACWRRSPRRLLSLRDGACRLLWEVEQSSKATADFLVCLPPAVIRQLCWGACTAGSLRDEVELAVLPSGMASFFCCYCRTPHEPTT
jgi:hypothetical protein